MFHFYGDGKKGSLPVVIPKTKEMSIVPKAFFERPFLGIIRQ